MGACASRFKVLKEGADAPLPEVASKELNLNETVKQDDAPATAATDEEAKHQSLGHLFKEIEAGKGSAESNVKAEVKIEDGTEAKSQENDIVKSTEPVVDAPAKETPATDGLKSETLEENKAEEKLAETAKPETLEKVETLETGKFEEHEPALDAEKKETEEKLAEVTKVETSEKIEDKQVIEPLKAETPVENKQDDKTKEQIPVSDAGKVKAGEETKK